MYEIYKRKWTSSFIYCVIISAGLSLLKFHRCVKSLPSCTSIGITTLHRGVISIATVLHGAMEFYPFERLTWVSTLRILCSVCGEISSGIRTPQTLHGSIFCGSSLEVRFFFNYSIQAVHGKLLVNRV